MHLQRRCQPMFKPVHQARNLNAQPQPLIPLKRLGSELVRYRVRVDPASTILEGSLQPTPLPFCPPPLAPGRTGSSTSQSSCCTQLLQEDGKWNKFGGRLAWDKSYICNNNPEFGGTGSHKLQEDYVAAPNLDHSQERVRKDITAWMKWLRNNVGYDGWRFDFVKGYGAQCCLHSQSLHFLLALVMPAQQPQRMLLFDSRQ